VTRAYYNENDPHAAQWLRNLIAEGLIAPGDVDDRSIKDVRADELNGYTQCHFFAGIGGWSYALRLAGWPDDRPVWTGSCPCQPFSPAGKGLAEKDPRHLWPTFYDLIEECRPTTVFGEQVAAKKGLAWLDQVANDLEASGYAVAAVDIPACGIGASHKRHRLWFVADTSGVAGRAHDRLVPGGVGGASLSARRLPRVEVSGGWWETDAGAECLPTLVRNHDGLSGQLAGFGNAIVPQVGAEFITAFMETQE